MCVCVRVCARTHACICVGACEVSAFPGGSVLKNLPAKAGDMGLIPGLGRSPGGGNANQSSALAWEIPRTEGPGRVQSMGSQGVGQDLVNKPCVPQGFL